MVNTKIVIALVAIAALTLAVIGLAAAQMAQNQTYTGESPYPQAPNNGFWGWIGSCFGLGGQPYYGSQYVSPQGPANTTAPAPYQPYQGGYYGNGYGYGYGYGFGC